MSNVQPIGAYRRQVHNSVLLEDLMVSWSPSSIIMADQPPAELTQDGGMMMHVYNRHPVQVG